MSFQLDHNDHLFKIYKLFFLGGSLVLVEHITKKTMPRITQSIKQIKKWSALISKSWAPPVRLLPSSTDTLLALNSVLSFSLSFQPKTTFLIRTASSAHPLYSLHSYYQFSVDYYSIQWRLRKAYGPYYKYFKSLFFQFYYLSIWSDMLD